MRTIKVFFCFVIMSLTACHDANENNLEPSTGEPMAIFAVAEEKAENKFFADFIYDVGPRFGAVKKSDIDKARSITDFIHPDVVEQIVYLKSVSVIIVKDDKQTDIREVGFDNEFTTAQLKLLQSSDYSTNFLIKAEFQQMNEAINELEPNYSSPYLTIVPEKQARYTAGKDALLKFLKENSESARANVDPEKLRTAKLYFTVSKNGNIENLRLDRPSGYPLVDKKMIELISISTGAWEPAENAKGEKVAQELVVSFGLLGC